MISEALVSLLLSLVKKCPTVCNTNHFVVLLGAYGVTLSSTGKTKKFSSNLFMIVYLFSSLSLFFLSALDQKLLILLREYEKNNVSLLKFQ